MWRIVLLIIWKAQHVTHWHHRSGSSALDLFWRARATTSAEAVQSGRLTPPQTCRAVLLVSFIGVDRPVKQATLQHKRDILAWPSQTLPL